MIPVVAAFTGYITNWFAVQMIFYPLQWTGIPIKRYPDAPLGWIGWQGIVPAKAASMAGTLTTMVTTKLVSVSEVFGRLDSRKVSALVSPQVVELADSIVDELPSALGSSGRAALAAMTPQKISELRALVASFVGRFVRDLQASEWCEERNACGSSVLSQTLRRD